MSKAEICPVCLGSGRYKRYQEGFTIPIETPCHGCGGKGWVEVCGHDKPQLPYKQWSQPPQPWATITINTSEKYSDLESYLKTNFDINS